MKKRNGFVSNSSSSSFIIGIGKIKPEAEEKVKAIAEKHPRDLKVWTLSELVEKQKNSSYWSGPRVLSSGKTIEVESFNSTCVSVNADPSKEELFLVMEFDGGGDDSDFSVYDADGDFIEMDYDKIDLDFFSSEATDLMNLFYNKELIENPDTAYGAGRDG